MSGGVPIAIAISKDSTPNANGKHVSLPKHCVLFLSSGEMNVEINAPMYTDVTNLLKNVASSVCCSGN